jgi:hypothetical protein
MRPTTGWPDWTNFRLLGDYFLKDVFWNYKRMPKFLGNFFRSKSCALILTKNGLGKILDTFLTNSSGHPANDQNRIDAILESCRMRVARHEIHCSCKQTFSLVVQNFIIPFEFL